MAENEPTALESMKYRYYLHLGWPQIIVVEL